MVWLIPLILMLFAPADPEPVLQRLDKFIASERASVEFEVESPIYEGKGKGTLRWMRPNSQFYEVAWGPGSAEFRQTKAGTMEIDRATNTYLEFAVQPRLVIPPGIAAALTDLAYPRIFASGGLKHVLPAATKYMLEEPIEIDGERVDQLVAIFDESPVRIEARAFVATDGRLLRYSEKSESPTGGQDFTFNFRNWKRPASFEANAFSLVIPDGYVPFGLPIQADPVEVGNPAPLGNWTASGGRAVDMAKQAKGQWLVLGFLDDSAPSVSSVQAWNRLKGLIGQSKVVSATIGKAPPGARADHAFPDADGKIASAFRSPGAPFFAVVAPSGEIAWLWFGYSPDKEQEMRESLASAVKRGS